MELLQLKYFLAAAKYEHMTRAANEIHIAQPALSQSINRLEDEMGVKLFKKNGRNISLTDAGAFFRDRVSEIVDNLETAVDDTRNIGSVENKTIRIHISAASIVITNAIIMYKKEHSDINFQLVRSSEEYGCDISICSEKVNSLNSNQGFVVKEEIFIAVSRESSLADRETIDLAELDNEDMLGLNKSRSFRQICDGFCKKSSIRPEVVFEGDSPESVKDLISMGVGVGFWPAFSWGKINTENIKLLRIKDRKCVRYICVRNHVPTNSAVHIDFINYLEKYLIKLSNS